MLKANKLHQLMNISADQLSEILEGPDLEGTLITTTFRSFAAPEPLDYRFIYDVMYLDESNEIGYTVACVSYNPETDKVTAGY